MDESNKYPKTHSTTAGTTTSVRPTSKPEEQSPDWREKALKDAWNAREMLIPACFSSIVGQQNVDAPGAKVYFNSYLRDAGEPADPVEKILLEQLLLAHHRLAQLHARAEGVTGAEHLKILNGAASRLLSEVRRLALAIRQYRSPISSRQFSVVHQQNVVTAGDQKVTYVDQSSAAQDKVTLSARSELEAQTNREGFGGRLGDRLGATTLEEPREGGCREEPASLVG